jgi:hypothetical protein
MLDARRRWEVSSRRRRVLVVEDDDSFAEALTARDVAATCCRGIDRSEVSFARRWAYACSSFEYQRDGGSKMFRTLEPTVPLAFSDRFST